MGVNPGFATLRRFVYLGRVAKAVRRRAMLAGLTPVTAKEYARTRANSSAMDRVMHEGVWYDTVKY